MWCSMGRMGNAGRCLWSRKFAGSGKRSLTFGREERPQCAKLQSGRVGDRVFWPAGGQSRSGGGEGAGAEERTHLCFAQLQRLADACWVVLEGGENAGVARS
jgi:hypothetical protein